jgi:hypothetical protein
MRNNYLQLHEGLESMDLSRLVHNEIHIDEYKSKLGSDEDIAVVSFKVGGKEPAIDLVNFIEKAYDWIIDADTSAGEMDDGDYIVFVEIERSAMIPMQIIEMLGDLVNLTGTEIESYRVSYHNDPKEYPCTVKTLRKLIPATPEKYKDRIAKNNNELNNLKLAAGVKINQPTNKNDYTESLKIAAGIL